MVTTLTPATQLLDVAARLRFAVARTARRMRQEAGQDLGPTLIAALASVENHGPLTPSELAEVERVKRPTATRITATLEERGLITRAADPTDGRACLLSISPGGRAHLRHLRKRKNAYLARRLDTLDADELATLDRASVILERLLEEEER